MKSDDVTTLGIVITALVSVLREFENLAIELRARPEVVEALANVEFFRETPGDGICAFVDASMDGGIGYDWRISVTTDSDRWLVESTREVNDAQGGRESRRISQYEGVEASGLAAALGTAAGAINDDIRTAALADSGSRSHVGP